MIFAVFDPSPLTVCINCSFLHSCVYDCLPVCLPVQSHISETARPMSPKFLYIHRRRENLRAQTKASMTASFIRVTCGRGLVLFWWQAIRYVLPVLWMTPCFGIMERMGRNLNGRECLCFVQFAKRRHRRRSLPSPTAISCATTTPQIEAMELDQQLKVVKHCNQDRYWSRRAAVNSVCRL